VGKPNFSSEPPPLEPAPADADVPEPPWLRSRQRRTRTQLTREAIVDAALRVLDCEGANGLSMRRLAEELGTAPGAVYWHVANKEELVQLLFDRVIGELPLPEVDPEIWDEQIKQAARDVREAMSRHPGLAQLSFGRVPLGPSALRYIEWHLSVLRAGGLPDQVAAHATDLIHLYVDSFAYEECVGMAPPSGKDGTIADFVAELRGYFESLPPDRFPNITALAEPLTTGGPDVRFEFGLDVLVGGLTALARRAT
jgi:TetR/AcrR family transcriptional regulator, tetracycline repressor protein